MQHARKNIHQNVTFCKTGTGSNTHKKHKKDCAKGSEIMMHLFSFFILVFLVLISELQSEILQTANKKLSLDQLCCKSWL